MDFNLKEEAAYRVGSIISDLVSGNDVQVGTVINTAEIANAAVTQNKVASGAVASQNINSAQGYQAGTGTLSTNTLWVVFPKAFATTPYIATASLNPISAVAAGSNVQAGSIAVGSFLAIGNFASQVFNWIAIGSFAAQ